MASCTFPSLNPPTTRDSKYQLKRVLTSQITALSMFPNIDHNRTFLRPWRSEREPMDGDTKNCSVENMEPISPPVCRLILIYYIV